jgi:hypothetical protein
VAKVVGTEDLPSKAECQDTEVLIFSVVDIDAVYKEWTDQGIEFEVAPQDFPDWGIRSVYLRNPDRNLIEIHTDLGPSSWSEGLKEASRKQGEG